MVNAREKQIGGRCGVDRTSRYPRASDLAPLVDVSWTKGCRTAFSTVRAADFGVEETRENASRCAREPSRDKSGLTPFGARWPLITGWSQVRGLAGPVKDSAFWGEVERSVAERA